MSPLYDFKKGFDYKYLNSNDVENIGNIILTNSIPFINQNRKIRLKWIKSSWKIKLPQNKQLGILQSIKLFITKPLVFRACEVSILKNLENYRVHRELIFLPQAEKGILPDIKLAKNKGEYIRKCINFFTKNILEKLHIQEVKRRKQLKKEDSVYNLTNSMEVKDVILLNYERHRYFGFKECVYLGQWEYKQARIIIKKIDRTFQRFMPNQTVTFKEVADRIHDKLDELSKEIDLMEKAKKLNSGLIENRIHETDLFQVKMELQFYNHYYSFINKQYLEREFEDKEESKNPEIGTVIQHNLMIYYLLEYGKIIRPDVNATKYAKFVRSLTGMSRESIRKSWTNATFQENTNPRKKDLKSIRAFFELIKAEGILKMIDNDLAMKNRNSRDNDGKSD